MSEMERWYDENPEVSECIRWLLSTPDEVRPIIASTLSHMVRQELFTLANQKKLKSLGPENIINLLKSHNKRREEDTEPNTHQVMTYMAFVPTERQAHIALHMNTVSKTIESYLQDCSMRKIRPNLYDIKRITQNALDTWNNYTVVPTQFNSTMPLQEEHTLEDMPTETKIDVETDDMRVVLEHTS